MKVEEILGEMQLSREDLMGDRKHKTQPLYTMAVQRDIGRLREALDGALVSLHTSFRPFSETLYGALEVSSVRGTGKQGRLMSQDTIITDRCKKRIQADDSFTTLWRVQS
jgi:hypothetical protein